MKKEIFEHYKAGCADGKQVCCADIVPILLDEGIECTDEAWDRWEEENRHLICYKCSEEPANV